jgi:hypothetical protein
MLLFVTDRWDFATLVPSDVTVNRVRALLGTIDSPAGSLTFTGLSAFRGAGDPRRIETDALG